MLDWFVLGLTRECPRFVRCLIGIYLVVLDSLLCLSDVLLVYFGSY